MSRRDGAEALMVQVLSFSYCLTKRRRRDCDRLLTMISLLSTTFCYTETTLDLVSTISDLELFLPTDSRCSSVEVGPLLVVYEAL